MKKRSGWSSRTLIRYCLFEIPDLALFLLILLIVRRYVVDLPGWFVWSSIIVWIVKDVILFPFVWRAYDRGQSQSAQAMVGEKAIAEERLAPSGYVRIHGELWKAVVMGGGPPIEKARTVRVREIRGSVVLVEPDQGETETE